MEGAAGGSIRSAAALLVCKPAGRESECADPPFTFTGMGAGGAVSDGSLFSAAVLLVCIPKASARRPFILALRPLHLCKHMCAVAGRLKR